MINFVSVFVLYRLGVIIIIFYNDDKVFFMILI